MVSIFLLFLVFSLKKNQRKRGIKENRENQKKSDLWIFISVFSCFFCHVLLSFDPFVPLFKCLPSTIRKLRAKKKTKSKKALIFSLFASLLTHFSKKIDSIVKTIIEKLCSESLSYLLHIISRTWDKRFSQIEVTAITELNRIVNFVQLHGFDATHNTLVRKDLNFETKKKGLIRITLFCLFFLSICFLLFCSFLFFRSMLFFPSKSKIFLLKLWFFFSSESLSSVTYFFFRVQLTLG